MGMWRDKAADFLKKGSLGGKTMTIQEARGVLWRALQTDEGFHECYIANIACVMMDAQSEYGIKLDMSDYSVRTAVATRILDHIFREETKEQA